MKRLFKRILSFLKIYYDPEECFSRGKNFVDEYLRNINHPVDRENAAQYLFDEASVPHVDDRGRINMSMFEFDRGVCERLIELGFSKKERFHDYD